MRRQLRRIARLMRFVPQFRPPTGTHFGVSMRTRFLLLLALLAVPLANAQQPPAAAQQQEVVVKATKLGGDVYGIDGQGGRMAALVGPEGVFLVDAQSPRVTDKIVAAIKQLSPAPLKLLVNTHV